MMMMMDKLCDEIKIISVHISVRVRILLLFYINFWTYLEIDFGKAKIVVIFFWKKRRILLGTFVVYWKYPKSYKISATNSKFFFFCFMLSFYTIYFTYHRRRIFFKKKRNFHIKIHKQKTNNSALSHSTTEISLYTREKSYSYVFSSFKLLQQSFKVLALDFNMKEYKRNL